MADGKITVEVSTQAVQAELERLRHENARLAREAHTWWTACAGATEELERLRDAIGRHPPSERQGLTDAELQRMTGEPHIDGWPLWSGIPKREAGQDGLHELSTGEQQTLNRALRRSVKFIDEAAEQGDSSDLADASQLVRDIAGAGTNGHALALVMKYRKAIRQKVLAATPPSPAQAAGWRDIESAPLPADKEKPWAVRVPGFGYVDLKAVRAIERAHGIGIVPATPESAG